MKFLWKQLVQIKNVFEKLFKFQKKKIKQSPNLKNYIASLCEPYETAYGCVCTLEDIEFNASDFRIYNVMHVTMTMRNNEECSITGSVRVPNRFYNVPVNEQIARWWHDCTREVSERPLALLQSHIVKNTVNEQHILASIEISNAFMEHQKHAPGIQLKAKEHKMILLAALRKMARNCCKMEKQNFEKIISALGLEDMYADSNGVIYRLPNSDIFVGAQFSGNTAQLLNPEEHAIYRRAMLACKLSNH